MNQMVNNKDKNNSSNSLVIGQWPQTKMTMGVVSLKASVSPDFSAAAGEHRHQHRLVRLRRHFVPDFRVVVGIVHRGFRGFSRLSSNSIFERFHHGRGSSAGKASWIKVPQKMCNGASVSLIPCCDIGVWVKILAMPSERECEVKIMFAEISEGLG